MKKLFIFGILAFIFISQVNARAQLNQGAGGASVTVVSPLPAGTNVIGHVITDTGSVSLATLTGSWPYSGALGTVSLTGTLPAFTSTPTFNCGTGCFQATQPVSGTFFQATQPISCNAAGTCPVNASQVTSPWIVAGGGTAGSPGTAVLTVQGIGSGTAIPVSGTFFQTTQPVSLTSTTITGTVAVTQSTSPWVASCTVGNCSINLGNWGGTALGAPTNFGTTPGAVISGSVNASLFSGTTALGAPNTFGTTAPTGNALGVNASLFIGTTLASNAAAGVQLVGITGHANGNFDAAGQNVASPANELLTGCQFQTTPTTISAGNMSPSQCGPGGALITELGSSAPFSCVVPSTTTALTQCQPAPAVGLKAYITSISMSNAAATVQTLDIVYGTGTHCATTATALTHKYQFGTVATTTSPFEVSVSFPTPLVPAAANEICVRPSAATAFGATITGFVAP